MFHVIGNYFIVNLIFFDSFVIVVSKKQCLENVFLENQFIFRISKIYFFNFGLKYINYLYKIAL